MAAEGCSTEFPFDFFDFNGDDFCCPVEPLYNGLDGVTTCDPEAEKIRRYQGDFKYISLLNNIEYL